MKRPFQAAVAAAILFAAPSASSPALAQTAEIKLARQFSMGSVSYTHLTLPTIYSV